MKIILVVILIFNSIFITAQNLIPNYSFEQNTSGRCPEHNGDLLADYWWSPNFLSTDYFNPCAESNSFLVPNNFHGSQGAATGNSYVGIRPIYESWAHREYIMVKLLDTLKSCEFYNVSFKVSLGDNYFKAVWQLGALFKKDSIRYYGPIDEVPHVTNKPGNFIVNKENWTTIENYYLAEGGEKYIILGSFGGINEIEYIDVGQGSSEPRSYYFLDDVSVTPVQPDTVVNDLGTYVVCHDSVYTRQFNDRIDSISIMPSNQPARTVLGRELTLNTTGNYKMIAYYNKCDLVEQELYEVSIRVKDCETELILPNVITPNNDGYNDVFKPIKNINTNDTKLIIFNRWGKQIINSDKIIWRPTNYDQDGIYYYFITYRDRDAFEHTLKGTITLKSP